MTYKTYIVRVYSNGATEWYQNGELNRDDGPAMTRQNGDKFWFKDGKYHREDGPACEYKDGESHWFKNGKLHREDGPALESVDGSKSWYLEGVYYSEEQFNRKMNPVKELTIEEISKILGYEIKIVK